MAAKKETAKTLKITLVRSTIGQIPVQSKFELVFRRKILDYYYGEPLTL